MWRYALPKYNSNRETVLKWTTQISGGNENVERSNSKPKISATSKYSLTLTQTPIVDKYLFIARWTVWMDLVDG